MNMFKAARKLLARLARDDRGLTAVEYAVLGAIVVAAIVAATTTFEADLTAAFKGIFAKT
jgi:pilus assembly protein Flp/PilA